MDEARFGRLETRVDEIKDDVAEVKAEQKIATHSMETLHQAMRENLEVMRSHVTDDNRIINQIKPILDDFQYRQEAKRRRTEKLKSWSLKLGVPATGVALVAGIIKLMDMFTS